MRKRLVVGLAVILLIASACAQGPTTAESQTFDVQVDGKTDEFVVEFTAFFPRELSVHPGDTVRFDLPNFSGAPHTVTLGTLVDGAVAKLKPPPPTATPLQVITEQENLPEMRKLTDIFPHQIPEAGPPDANQSAAQPCFLDSGEPPNSETGSAPACPERAQPEFDGSQSFFNSGALMADGDSFTLKVSEATAPTSYSIICLVHRGAMTGKLNVVDPETEIPGPAEVKAKGDEQFDQTVAALRPAFEQAKSAPVDKAVAGTGSPSVPDAVIAEFGPKELAIPLGGSVTWTFLFFHTIAFNASEDAVGVLVKAADGSVHFNPKGAPASSPSPPLEYAVFPPTATEPITVDAGTFDGTGFKNSGIVGSIPPALISYKVEFTKAGSFEFRCLVHPDMKGKVNVG